MHDMQFTKTKLLHLCCADYGEALRAALRRRDGVSDKSDERLLARFERLKQRARLQGPEIERTMLKLAKAPMQRSLWSRLVQRLLGYAVGVAEVRTLLIKRDCSVAQGQSRCDDMCEHVLLKCQHAQSVGAL